MGSMEFNTWLNNFRTTGDICPLKLGATRNEVRALFGEPDTTGGTSRKHTIPTIWKYESLEFHFGNTLADPLFLIYQETEDGIVEVCIKKNNA